MFRNLAWWDRAARAFLAVALFLMAIVLNPRALYALPAVWLIITAAVGNDPIYMYFHINTHKKAVLKGVSDAPTASPKPALVGKVS